MWSTLVACVFLLPHFAFRFFIFFWFQREDFRKQYQEENPEVKSMREVKFHCFKSIITIHFGSVGELVFVLEFYSDWQDMWREMENNDLRGNIFCPS